jgi:hypothetical protein
MASPTTDIAVYTIIPEKGADKWEVIGGIIRDYARLHPWEMRETLQTNRIRRGMQRNRHGSTRDRSLRHGLSVPMGLLLTLKRFYPEVFTEKAAFRTFMRKFPGFRIPERI